MKYPVKLSYRGKVLAKIKKEAEAWFAVSPARMETSAEAENIINIRALSAE